MSQILPAGQQQPQPPVNPVQQPAVVPQVRITYSRALLMHYGQSPLAQVAPLAPPIPGIFGVEENQQNVTPKLK